MIKCKFKGCNITQQNKLQLHHIVRKEIFPENDKKNKGYDLVEIDGIKKSNRVYLCNIHHNFLQQRQKDLRDKKKIFESSKEYLEE